MQIFFSDIKSVILSQLSSANKEIRIAVSWLTDRELFEIILLKLRSGIKVEIITRNDYLNNHANALDWNAFIEAGGKLRFCQLGKMLHYKFAVIDSKSAIATSYNWTCFAGINNRENIMVFNEPETIQSFLNEFEFLKTEFSLENNPERIELQDINAKLHGFYEMTISDDEKYQSVTCD